MARSPKPLLVAIYLDGWILAAYIATTKTAAAAHAFGLIEDPQGTTQNSLARYTTEVFRDPKTKKLWGKPGGWSHPRVLADALFPKAFVAHIKDKECPPLSSNDVFMPIKKTALTRFKNLCET